MTVQDPSYALTVEPEDPGFRPAAKQRLRDALHTCQHAFTADPVRKACRRKPVKKRIVPAVWPDDLDLSGIKLSHPRLRTNMIVRLLVPVPIGGRPNARYYGFRDGSEELSSGSDRQVVYNKAVERQAPSEQRSRLAEMRMDAMLLELERVHGPVEQWSNAVLRHAERIVKCYREICHGTMPLPAIECFRDGYEFDGPGPRICRMRRRKRYKSPVFHDSVYHGEYAGNYDSILHQLELNEALA